MPTHKTDLEMFQSENEFFGLSKYHADIILQIDTQLYAVLLPIKAHLKLLAKLLSSTDVTVTVSGRLSKPLLLMNQSGSVVS